MARIETKKQTILGRLWRGVILPVTEAADFFSWILFVTAIVVTVGALLLKFQVLEVKGSANFFDAHYWQFVYLSWALFVVSTVGPLLHISHEKAEIPIAILASVAVIHVLTFLVISATILLLESSNVVSAITTLLGAAAAASMAGIGWVIQYQSSLRSSRRTHTFNVLMQTRLSSEFQEHVRKRSVVYPTPTEIPIVDLKVYKPKQQNAAVIEFEKEAEKRLGECNEGERPTLLTAIEKERVQMLEKHEALRSVKYLLNFYEFLCAGIKQNDLDEDLLFETLSTIATSLYRDTKYVRQSARTDQPMAFEHFCELMESEWLDRERQGNEKSLKTKPLPSQAAAA